MEAKDTDCVEVAWRWVELAAYFFANTCNAMMWVTFSPISLLVSETYDVSLLMVELCSLVFMATYVPCVFPSNYLMDHYGLKTGLLTGIALTAVGAVVRIGAFYSFYFALLGQGIASLAQPLLLNAPPKLSATWFSPTSRPLATTIGVASGSVGIAIGLLVPPQIVYSSSANEIGILMVVEASFIVLVLLLCLISIKDKPEVPPSASAGETRLSARESLSSIFKNRNYFSLLMAFCFSSGTFNTLATMIGPLTQPFGFSPVFPI